MTPSKFSDFIVQKIQKEHIKPIARWHFVLKNILFWCVFTVSILLGAIGFSVIIFALQQAEIGIVSVFFKDDIPFFLALLPLFWIVFFVLFVLFSFWGVQHTKKGYRLPFWMLLGINMVLSIGLGTSFHAFDGGEKIEKIVSDNAPFYQGMERKMKKVWHHPQYGRISGRVLSIQDENIFLLDSFSGDVWEIDTSTRKETDHFAFEILPDALVKILGKPLNEKRFKADIIRPFMPYKQMHTQKCQFQESCTPPFLHPIPSRIPPPLKQNSFSVPHFYEKK